MATGYRLLDKPNPHGTRNNDGRYHGRQYRRERPSGCVVVHDTEGPLDTAGPDTSAEATANYFTFSERPASYHDVVDSDSTVHCLPYDHEAYHDATGTNSHAGSVSFGQRAVDWGKNPAHDEAALRNGARSIADQMRFAARARGHPEVPRWWVRWIGRAQARNREPGMVLHGVTDPTRRSDPWRDHPLRPQLEARLAELVQLELGHTSGQPEPTEEDFTVADIAAINEHTDAALAAAEAELSRDVALSKGRWPFRIEDEPEVYYLADGPDGRPVKVHVVKAAYHFLLFTGYLTRVEDAFMSVRDASVVAWLRSLATVEGEGHPE